MSEVGYMAHRQKMSHTPDLNYMKTGLLSFVTVTEAMTRPHQRQDSEISWRNSFRIVKQSEYYRRTLRVVFNSNNVLLLLHQYKKR